MPASDEEPEPPTRQFDRDEIVAMCLDEFHGKRALGERPMPEDFAERAGAAYPDFLAVLAAEQAIDDVVEPAAEGLFPRPFGEYTLLRELGRGAVGIVFEAMHRRLGRKVALKVLRGGFDDDQASIERFRREAMALAQVKHDHVVDVYEAGEVDGRPFYAMELLDGVSLWKLAKEKKLPALRALCGGLADVADALQKLHDAGIVHRDVKPSNIMVRADGRMLLADFGLARTATSEALTRTGEALGTPLYMSPEQVLGKKGGVDGRTDVYAVGATLYELVGGRPPCKGEDIASTLRKILTERPAPLSTRVRDLPADAERIVMKAIEKRPEDRYQTAGALRDDLRAFAKGAAVFGKPVSATTHAVRGARRFLRPIAAVVVAAAVLAAWLATRPAAPSRLEVTTHPAAEVFVDGSPVARDVPPGPHKVALHLAGFDDATYDVTIEPRTLVSKEIDLVATDANDPKTVEKIAGDLGVSLERTAPPAAAPSAAHEPFVPLFPRGRVRIDDLDSLTVEISAGFDASGAIRFFRKGETLGSVSLPATTASSDVAIPDDVKKAIAVGDAVKWGWVPAKGAPSLAEFRVVATPPPGTPRAGRLAEMAKKDPNVGRGLGARELCNQGFCSAAFREARAVARERPMNPFAWETMMESLLREGLDGTNAFRDAQAGYDAAKAAAEKRAARPPK